MYAYFEYKIEHIFYAFICALKTNLKTFRDCAVPRPLPHRSDNINKFVAVARHIRRLIAAEVKRNTNLKYERQQNQ